MNISKIRPYLLFQFKDDRELVSAINELSLNFTQNRTQISDYLKDVRLTSAYTAFYLSTNIPKLAAVFEWMPEAWLEKIRSSTFIDMGAGPGTFSLAFREWMSVPAKIIQVETSLLMREQAKKLWDGLYPGEKIIQSMASIKEVKEEEEEKVLFFGHSANEMGVDQTLKYIKDFNPEHILFVEPGTKDFFAIMIQIREKLIEQGYDVIYPCPRAEKCPIAASATDWCHQFVHVRQEHDVERLSQMAKKDRRHLPLIVHAFSKSFQAVSPSIRVIRVLPETKFSYEWEVCELNQLAHYQIMKRDLSKDEQDQLSKVLAGAAIEVELVKEIEKKKRVKVTGLNNKSLKLDK